MALRDSAPKARTGHAVVIGAGVAGLLAARALSDTYAQVTVFDRDVLPGGPVGRRGVPQSRQAHALLARGSDALDELLPGLSDELIAAGSATGDIQSDFRWYLDGYLMRRGTSGLRGIGLSRPLIELMIRTRVAALPGVKIVDSTDVLALVTTADTERVTGVRVQSRSGDLKASLVAADLVVDAAGRGSRALTWLGELGYPIPRKTQVRTDVVYLTRHYRREPHHLDGRNGAAVIAFPGQPRGGAVIAQEGDRFVVLLAGMLGEDPPTDDEGMLAFAEGLGAPDIAEVLRTSSPLDEPVKMRFPASVRHHYETLDRYLDGYLVLGDALCSFNPVYGQGMTVAALEALTLQQILAAGTNNLSRRFFPRVSKALDNPWLLAVGGDLRFPEVEGTRQPADQLINKYLDRYRAAASVDPVLGTSFLRVANMTASHFSLLSPGHMIRVFRASGKATKAMPISPPLG